MAVSNMTCGSTNEAFSGQLARLGQWPCRHAFSPCNARRMQRKPWCVFPNQLLFVDRALVSDLTTKARHPSTGRWVRNILRDRYCNTASPAPHHTSQIARVLVSLLCQKSPKSGLLCAGNKSMDAEAPAS